MLCFGVEKNIKEPPTIFIIPVYSSNTRQQCSQSRALSVKSYQRALSHLNKVYECIFQADMTAALSGPPPAENHSNVSESMFMMFYFFFWTY